MSFTPDNYLTAEAAIDAIVAEATGHFNNVKRDVVGLQRHSTKLAGMVGDWGPAVQFIDAQVAANPDDPQWQDLGAKATKVVTDFRAMQVTAQTAATAAADAL